VTSVIATDPTTLPLPECLNGFEGAAAFTDRPRVIGAAIAAMGYGPYLALGSNLRLFVAVDWSLTITSSRGARGLGSMA
jgi:hypothetical protein